MSQKNEIENHKTTSAMHKLTFTHTCAHTYVLHTRVTSKIKSPTFCGLNQTDAVSGPAYHTAVELLFNPEVREPLPSSTTLIGQGSIREGDASYWLSAERRRDH